MKKNYFIFAIGVLFAAYGAADSQNTPTNAEMLTNGLIEDFRVNDDVTGANQVEVAMAIASDGSFMIVWEDGRNNESDIYGQLYNSSGTPDGSNFRINTDFGTRNHTEPAIAVDGFGRYIVAWEDRTGDNDILAQRFNSNGSPIGGNFRVNDDSGGSQILSAVDAHTDGSFVVVWQDTRNGTDDIDIYGQRYRSDGSTNGSNFKINDGIGSKQRLPTISIAGNGNYVVVWWDDRETNNSALTNIYGQRYSSSGSKLGNNFRIDQDPGLSLRVVPEVETDAAGNFVVVWYDTRNGDHDIFGRRFRSDGVALGNDFQINDGSNGSSNEQFFAAIGMNNTGSFVVAWQNGHEEDTVADLSAQKYNSNGVPIGSNYKVGQDAGVPIQRKPDVKLVDNTVYIVWEDNRLSGRGLDIFARTDPFDDMQPTLASIKIVEGQSGDGPELSSKSLTADQILTVHAAGYDASNNYLGDEVVSWSSTGTLAPPVSTSGTSFTFSPTTAPASGTIVATHAAVGSDATGTISVSVGQKQRVKILTGASGNTTEVTTASLTAGQTLLVHASSFDADDNYVSDEAVNWSVSGNIGSVNPPNGISTTFSAETVGTGQIFANHATLTDDVTATITVLPGPLSHIKIITGSAGNGSELGDTTLTADETLILHAASYDADGNYRGDEIVNWASTGTLAPAVSATAMSITFSPTTAPAAGTIVASHATAGVDITGTISVNVGEAHRVKILNAASGNTNEVVTVNLVTGSMLAVHAGSFDGDNNYIMDEAVDWKVSGGIGSLNQMSNSPSTVFTATMPGTGVIVADHSTLIDDATGIITVNPGELSFVRIVQGENGDESELADTTITADQTLVLHAAGYDATDIYLGDEQVVWSSTGTLNPTVSRTSISITFDPILAPASGTIVASHVSAGHDTTGVISVDVGQKQRIRILRDASSHTNEVLTVGLMVGDTLMVHTSSFDADGNYVSDESADWSISGDIGELNPTQGISTTFTATANGTGQITANHSVLGNDLTGTITVSSDPPPSAPQNLQAQDGNAEVRLTWDANTETDFLRYRIFGGTTLEPETQIDSVDGISNTTKPITGLTNGTTYYFRLTAVDQAMQKSGFSNEVSATPTENVDMQTPQITHTPVSEAAQEGQNLSISTRASDAGSGIQTVTLFYRHGGAAAYTSVAMNLVGGDTYNGTIPASAITIRGLEYYISAQDSAGNSATDPAGTPEPNPYVIQVASNNLALAKTTPAGAYRMISVPFRLNNPSPNVVLVNDLGNYDDTQWRFFRYKNGANVEYNSLNFAVDKFDPGMGFWLITRNSTTLDAGAGVSVSTGGNFTITLQPGWNQIGNPFAFPVNWSDVVRGANVENQLVGYQGSSNEAAGYDITRTRLEPFEGYFVRNNSASLVSIEIPPKSAIDGSAAPKTATALFSHDVLGNSEWLLQITASAGNYLDKDNYLGSLHNAEVEHDRNDLSEAPFFADFVSLYFPHQDWQDYPGLYTADFRPASDNGQIWDFQVKTNLDNTGVTLALAELENLPEGWDMRLLDRKSQIVLDLQQERNYTYLPTAGETTRDFRIVAGMGKFVEESELEITSVPQQFVLQQNYPNPFNPSTVISFQLPVNSRVELAIYAITGRLIRTLVASEMPAGYHKITWDGTDESGVRVPSGVYLVRLSADGQFAAMRKMVLAK